MLKSGENGLIGPGSNDYGKLDSQGFFSREDYGGFPEDFLKEELKKATENMKVTDSIPRRIRLDLMVPAELAIYNAVQEVEKLGADTRLTEIVVMLDQAKDLVSDYVDEQVKTK